MTGFGSFDDSTCKRVLDLLEPGDLRLGQVVIKRVAVVKLGVNNGSGDGGSGFGIKIPVWTDSDADDLLLRCGLVRRTYRDGFGDGAGAVSAQRSQLTKRLFGEHRSRLGLLQLMLQLAELVQVRRRVLLLHSANTTCKHLLV